MDGAPSPPLPARRRLGRLLRHALQAAVLLLAGWFVWRVLASIGWHELRAQIGHADAGWVALSVVLLVLRFVVWDFRWRLAFRRLGPLPTFFHTFFSLLGSACANTLMPGARVVGGLLRARHVAAPTRTFGRVYGVIFFDQAVHQMVLFITGWTAFVGMAVVLGHRTVALGALVALVVAAAIAAHWIARLDEARVERLSAWAARRSGGSGASTGGGLSGIFLHGSDAVRVVRMLLADASLRRAALLLTLLYVLLNGLAQWTLFRAIDFRADLLTVLLGVTAGTAAGAFTGTPGGAGTTEAGMILAYAALGVPKAEAGAATLLYRGLHYLVILGLGLPALAVFEARLRRRGQGRNPVEEMLP